MLQDASRGRRWRLLLAGLSIVALGAIVFLVQSQGLRSALAALAIASLTWSAYSAGSRSRRRGLARGLRERRKKHVLRHHVNEFVNSVRRLDRLARGASEGQLSRGAAEDAISEIYRSLDELTRQIRIRAGRND